jgi:hypothetical protein
MFLSIHQPSLFSLLFACLSAKIQLLSDPMHAQVREMGADDVQPTKDVLLNMYLAAAKTGDMEHITAVSTLSI